MWRVNVFMTPIRANIVGPPSVATRIRASVAVCDSSASCSALGSFVMYSAASRSVMSWRPRAGGIGSSNGRFQPLGELGEEISTLLREPQAGAGRMHRDPAARDSRFHGGRILVVSAACGNELRIDGADLQPAGMVRLNPVCYLQQLADRGVDIGERAILFELHFPPSGPNWRARHCLPSAYR